jgi:signal peptidase I
MAAVATVSPPETLSRASYSLGSSAGAVRAWFALVLLLLARGFRAFLLTLLAAATVPMLWSWTSYVVQSGSMEPALSVGDVVVAKPFSSESPVPVGKVMLFTPPTTTEGHETRIHRVVENLGEGQYTTAGDANRSDDPEPVPRKNFMAQPLIRVPFVAAPLTWFSSRNWLPLILILLITMAAFYFSSRPPGDPRQRQRELSKARRAAETGAVILRRGFVPLSTGVAIVAAVMAGLPAQADAAFSATTANSGLTWKVSSTLSNSLVLASPTSTVRGTVPLTATLSNTGGFAYSVRMEYAPAGTTTWSTICTKASAPYTCDWVTTGYVNRSYDLRAVATSGAMTYTSVVRGGILVDNAAPSVTMQDPGTPLRGAVTFAATAADTNSGVARVLIQYALTGSTVYQDLCTIGAAPYSCLFDTTTMPGGTYTFRAIATDVAGNTSTSALVTNRIVDNTVSSVVMNDPGALLSGIVSLTAAASSTAGVTSVRIQGSPAGSGTWTDVCTDSSSPYSCSYDTSLAPDGLYDMRAILTDGAGKTTISNTVVNRKVDNTAPRAFDVQTTNGGTAGKLDPGDTINLTYNEQMKLSTFTSGWDGTALGVTVRLRDGSLVGLAAKDDTLDILRSGAAVNLGAVNLREDYISGGLTAQFAATMSASTTTVNGVTATRVTITVGAQTTGTTVRTVTLASVMTWAPSVLATDLAGRAAAGTSASESGAADREF